MDQSSPTFSVAGRDLAYCPEGSQSIRPRGATQAIASQRPRTKGPRSLIQSEDGSSFIEQAADAEPVMQPRMDIVKSVLSVMIEENAKADTASDSAANKQKITGLIAERKDEALKGKPREELKSHARPPSDSPGGASCVPPPTNDSEIYPTSRLEATDQH